MSLLSPEAASPPPTVTANGGLITGKAQPASRDYPRALDLFFGIPCASVSRFQPAVPIAPPSSGVIDASEQAPSQPFPFAPHLTAENPLTINIIRPSSSSSSASDQDGYNDSDGSSPSSSLPVVVYIHGGGFNFGHPLERDLASFVSWAKKDVMAVAISYRLGALGFLAGGAEVKELNLGLRDQRLAIEWVRDWIGAFGGNANDLTLMGVSAGAHSVSFLLLFIFSCAFFSISSLLQRGGLLFSFSSGNHVVFRGNKKTKTST